MRSCVLSLFLSAVTLASAIDWPARVPAPTGNGTWAPLTGLDDDVIDSKYIVIFQPYHTLEQHFVTIGRNLSGLPGFKILLWLPGYTALFFDNATLDVVRPDPNVLLVETDKTVHLIQPVEPMNSSNNSIGDGHHKREYLTETNYKAPYGLQQVGAGSKLATPVFNGGEYDMVYLAGLGTQIYILDTGIRLTHSAFGGRASNFPSTLQPGDNSPYVEETPDDTHGHGTHVAGTAAGSQYGVAPHATIWNVKVIGSGANVERIGSAVSDVAADHNNRKYGDTTGFRWRGSVINMSLTIGGYSAVLQSALQFARDSGISVFVAAGNNNQNVWSPYVYPCVYPNVDCVGAVDNNYNKYSGPNYGSAVEYVAPGVNVLSCGIANDNDWTTLTGTSMATPHVSGAAAIFTSWLGIASSSVYSTRYLWWNALRDITTGWDSSTNNLFVTTGIHSPQKYRNEPFRWAGDYPLKDPQTLEVTSSFSTDDVSATPTLGPSSALYITQYSMATTTDSPLAPGTTESGNPTETIADVTVTESDAYTSTTFSYDPTTIASASS